MGDLAKLVMAEDGKRDVPGGRDSLEHELADCLWAVLVLADLHGVDIAAAFDRTTTELTGFIQQEKDQAGTVVRT